MASRALEKQLSKKDTKPRDAESGLDVDGSDAAYSALPTRDGTEGQSFGMTPAAARGALTAASSLSVGNESRGSRRASVASSKEGSEACDGARGAWGREGHEETSQLDDKR